MLFTQPRQRVFFSGAQSDASAAPSQDLARALSRVGRAPSQRRAPRRAQVRAPSSHRPAAARERADAGDGVCRALIEAVDGGDVMRRGQPVARTALEAMIGRRAAATSSMSAGEGGPRPIYVRGTRRPSEFRWGSEWPPVCRARRRTSPGVASALPSPTLNSHQL